jgi:hypothetical protein
MAASGASIGRRKPLHAPGADCKMRFLQDVLTPGTPVYVLVYYITFFL